MKDRYVSCYAAGRCEAFEGRADLEMLVEKVCAGSPMRETVLSLARKSIMDEMDAATKVAWLKDNLEEIKQLGGDTEKAWKAFCDGRIDALALQLDEDAMEEIVNKLEEEDAEADPDDEEDEDEEESEDSDDDQDSDEDDEEDE